MLWSGINVIAKSGVRFLTTALLARVLLPEDFGILGMALMVNEIVSLLGSLSLGQALVQKRKVDDRYFHTMFWANLAVGVGLGVCFVIAAPAASAFFRNDRVGPVVMVMALNFLLTTAGGVHRAMLTRQLQFRRFSIINVTSTVVRSILSLALVYGGAGLWGVVAGILAERATTLVLLVTMVPWRPRFEFHADKFKELFRFSRNLYADNFIRYFNANTDFLLTGRLLGARALGYYQLAYNLPHIVLTHFSETVSEVLFPIYCRVQDDHARFRRGFMTTVRFISLVTFPCMAGLAVVAPEFVRAVYGPNWNSSIVPMQILCLAAAANSVIYPSGALCHSKGRPDIGLKWNMLMLPLTFLALYVGSRWGIAGIAAAMSILALCSIFVVRITLGLIGLGLPDYFRALLPAIFGSVAMALALFGVRAWAAAQWPALSDMAALGGYMLVGAGVYAASVRLGWPEASFSFLSFASHIFGRRGA
jgi:PST family polysaccharide transporter